MFQFIDPNSLNWSRALQIQKVATIKARPAKPGERINTDLNGFNETTNKAKAGDFIITNPDGEEYIVSDFLSRYKETSPGWYIKTLIEPFIYVQQDVAILTSWGEMKIKAGGAIVKSNDGFYGIQPEQLNNSSIYKVFN